MHNTRLAQEPEMRETLNELLRTKRSRIAKKTNLKSTPMPGVGTLFAILKERIN
jgi:hypothetical protein